VIGQARKSAAVATSAAGIRKQFAPTLISWSGFDVRQRHAAIPFDANVKSNAPLETIICLWSLRL